MLDSQLPMLDSQLPMLDSQLPSHASHTLSHMTHMLDSAPHTQAPARLLPGPILEFAGGRTVDTGSKGEWFPPKGSPINTPGKAWASGAVLCFMDERQHEQGTLMAAYLTSTSST